MFRFYLLKPKLAIQNEFVHFFCSAKRNEPKKMAPEMTTSAKTGACYTGLNGSTVFTEVRTISGLPPLHIRIFLYAVKFCIFSV